MVVLCNSLTWRLIDTQNHYWKKKANCYMIEKILNEKGFKSLPHSALLKHLNCFAFSPTERLKRARRVLNEIQRGIRRTWQKF